MENGRYAYQGQEQEHPEQYFFIVTKDNEKTDIMGEAHKLQRGDLVRVCGNRMVVESDRPDDCFDVTVKSNGKPDTRGCGRIPALTYHTLNNVRNERNDLEDRVRELVRQGADQDTLEAAQKDFAKSAGEYMELARNAIKANREMRDRTLGD